MLRKPAILGSFVFAVAALSIVLIACGSSEPSRSQPQPSSSPAASPPAAASTAPSANPSAKVPSGEEQAYQKAQSNWSQVVEAARKEGPATLYTATNTTVNDSFMKAFNSIDPKIQVSLVRRPGAQAVERLKAEASTKQYASDGYLGGSTSCRLMADDGMGQMIDDIPVLYEPGAKWMVSPLLDKPHETLTWGLDKYQFLINTNALPADQQPKTWKDLADPKWKNKITLWDPRVPSIGQNVLGPVYASPAHGPDMARKIIENMRVAADSSESTRQVAAGEIGMTVASWGGYLPVKAAPVTMVMPADGTIAPHLQIFVVKNAPQLNTTKVFVNWLLSQDGQKVVSESYSAVRSDLEPLTKAAQVGDVPFMANVPFSWDFERAKMPEVVKQITAWTDEAGK